MLHLSSAPSHCAIVRFSMPCVIGSPRTSLSSGLQKALHLILYYRVWQTEPPPPQVHRTWQCGPDVRHRITSRNRRGFSQIAAYTHRLPHTAIRPAGRPQWWTGGRNPSTARTPGNTPAPLLPPRTASMTSRASAQRMALCTATIPQRRPVPRHGSGFAQAPRHSRTP